MYSTDFRVQVIRLYFENLSFKKVGRMMNISSSTVHRWVTTTPNLTTKRKKQRAKIVRKKRRKVTDTMMQSILQYIKEHPVTTLKHIRQHIRTEYGCTLHRQTISSVLKHECNVTRKRTSQRLAGGANVPQELIDKFKQKFNQYVNEGRLFCSVDECNNSEKVLPKEGHV